MLDWFSVINRTERTNTILTLLNECSQTQMRFIVKETLKLLGNKSTSAGSDETNGANNNPSGLGPANGNQVNTTSATNPITSANVPTNGSSPDLYSKRSPELEFVFPPRPSLSGPAGNSYEHGGLGSSSNSSNTNLDTFNLASSTIFGSTSSFTSASTISTTAAVTTTAMGSTTTTAAPALKIRNKPPRKINHHHSNTISYTNPNDFVLPSLSVNSTITNSATAPSQYTTNSKYPLGLNHPTGRPPQRFSSQSYHQHHHTKSLQLGGQWPMIDRPKSVDILNLSTTASANNYQQQQQQQQQHFQHSIISGNLSNGNNLNSNSNDNIPIKFRPLVEPDQQQQQQQQQQLQQLQQQLAPLDLSGVTYPSNTEDVGVWLKSFRLHKYTECFKDYTWSQVINLSERDLETLGVNTLGARRKMMRLFDEVKSKLV